MKKKRDNTPILENQKYGRLQAIKRVYRKNKKYAYWECICDCGEVKIVQADALRSGRIKSCGCARRESARKNNNIFVDRDIHASETYMLHLTGRFFSRAKSNAEKRKIPFNLSREDLYDLEIYQDGKCYLTEAPLDTNNVSIDRLDSNLPYCIDNINLVAKEANFIKNTLTLCQLWDVCAIVIDKDSTIEMPKMFEGKTYKKFKMVEKEDLLYNYITLKKSVKELAKIYKLETKNICEYLNLYGISDENLVGETKWTYDSYCSITGERFYRICNSAKARKKKVEISAKFMFELFLKQNRKCAISGVEIFLDSTASLDRIDSSKDYTEDNVRWIHSTLNCMKTTLPDEEFIYWLSKINDVRKKVPF